MTTDDENLVNLLREWFGWWWNSYNPTQEKPPDSLHLRTAGVLTAHEPDLLRDNEVVRRALKEK